MLDTVWTRSAGQHLWPEDLCLVRELQAHYWTTNEYMYVGLGLSQETERPKGKAKLSEPFEKVYLVLPFSFNLLRFEAETNLFASLLTSHTLSSTWSQSRNTQVQILTTAKALLYRLEIIVWKAHAPKEILNEICRICSNILLEYWNIWRQFLWAVPDLRIWHLKIGQETSKLGACTNRFDCSIFDIIKKHPHN